MTLYQETKKDKRYEVNLEWCGQSTQKYIARFCGDFVGWYETETKAWCGAKFHNEKRLGLI